MMKFKCSRAHKEKSDVSTNPLGYKDLMPVDNAEDCETSLSALNWALKSPKIKNIALSGPYGSGKSSIIQTYIKRNPNDKYLQISMANFETSDTDIISQETKGREENELLESEKKVTRKKAIPAEEFEEYVLKQLFYKVDYKKIPQSRYRKLHNIRLMPLFGISLIAWLAVTVVCYLLFAPDILADRWSYEICASNVILSLAYMFILVLLSYGTASLFRYLIGRVHIEKVEVSGASVQNTTTNSDSIFNKNLDEIVYFFEATGYKVVFFEDLDRWDDISVFAKLRELNVLLNSYEVIHDSHQIKFIYAVRDDIFTEEERTKFFDFIIPVIPVINSTNSGEILFELLTDDNGNRKYDIPDEYITDVSPYISDMRMLLNIYNEFITYRGVLQKEQGLELQDQQLLSMMIFKNLYPADFAALQDESGIVKQAFIDKTDFIRQETLSLQNDIDAVEGLLKSIEDDTLHDLKELKLSMMAAITGWKGIATKFTVDNKTFSESDLRKDNFDLAILNKNAKKISGISYRSWSNFNSQTLPAADSNRVLEEFRKYVERLENISILAKGEIDKKQEEAEQKRRRKYTLNGYSLCALIEEYGADRVLSIKVRKNKLLVFMLRRGYINETYSDYINYFKGNSLTRGDMNFILSVRDGDPKEFNYSLSKTEQVIGRLQTKEFGERAIYNFDLLNYLLSSDNHEDDLILFVKQLADGTADSWKFVDEFFNVTGHRAEFIKTLVNVWPEFWERISKDTILTYGRKIEYLTCIIEVSDIDTLTAMDANGALGRFLGEHADVLKRLSPIGDDKLKEIISALNVSFEDLEDDGISPELFSFVCNGSYYEVNEVMIRKVVEKYDPESGTDLAFKNYTTVCKLGYKPLLNHIYDNWEKYLTNVILQEKNVDEELEYVLDMLTRSFDDEDKCIRIVSHENFMIDDIEDCLPGLVSSNKRTIQSVWNAIFDRDKVAATWKNIREYWDSMGYSDVITNFIDRNAKIINGSDPDLLEGGLLDDVLKSNISDHAFEQLIVDVSFPKEHVYEFGEMTPRRISTMIRTGTLPFTEEIFNNLCITHEDLCSTFIISNPNANIQNIQMNQTIAEEIIASEDSVKALKERVLSIYGTEFMSAAIAEKLLDGKLVIEKETFFAAMEKLGSDDKKQLLYSYIDILDAEDFSWCFEKIPAFKGLTDRSKRHSAKLNDTRQNRKLGKRLIDVGYCTSCRPDDSKKQSSYVEPGLETEEKMLILWVKQFAETEDVLIKSEPNNI